MRYKKCASLYLLLLLRQPLSAETPDIPDLIALYNERCKSCEAICPQQIRISEAMKDFSEKLGM